MVACVSNEKRRERATKAKKSQLDLILARDPNSDDNDNGLRTHSNDCVTFSGLVCSTSSHAAQTPQLSPLQISALNPPTNSLPLTSKSLFNFDSAPQSSVLTFVQLTQPIIREKEHNKSDSTPNTNYLVTREQNQPQSRLSCTCAKRARVSLGSIGCLRDKVTLTENYNGVAFYYELDLKRDRT